MGAPSGALGTMPFTILRQHARGGLGLVNLARDEHIRREVALKQILPQHADNGTLKKRFLYEAQITGQLEHPSIVPVYTLGEDAGANPYYVMRFVKGRTLDEIIKEHHAAPNPIVLRELLRRFVAVCQAVAYAHSRGVIHRDLKPSNIMLGDYGETLVLDWGLAKDIKNKQDPALFIEENAAAKAETTATAKGNTIVPSAELTMEGQIIGTPAYMAPEQAEGKTELHAPVTDIYALGGILYKILAGVSPSAPQHTLTPAMGLRRLRFVESPPPSKVNKDVDPLLERMCMRAMATDPLARYPRAQELSQDITRWLDEHPLMLKRESGLAMVVRRYGGTIILGLLVVIFALLIALITRA
jgi:serine/threonine protein kinase